MYVVLLPSFKRINHVFSLLNVLLKSRTDTVRTRTTDSTRHHKGRRRWTLGFKIRHVDLIHTQTFVAFIKRGFVLHWNVGTVFDVDSKMRLSKNQRFRPSNHVDRFVLKRHVARVVERRFSFHKWIAQTFRNFTLDPTTQRDHVAIAGAFHGGLCKIHNPSCCCCWFIKIIRGFLIGIVHVGSECTIGRFRRSRSFAKRMWCWDSIVVHRARPTELAAHIGVLMFMHRPIWWKTGKKFCRR